MSFRDETDALRHRIEQLEREREELRAERDRAVEERDEARREAAESEAEREARLVRSSPFPKGAPVLVEWKGRWWDGTVLEVKGARRWRIHYDGWSASWDEDVGPSRILARDAQPPGPRAGHGLALAPVLVGILVLGVLAIAIYFVID